MHGPRPRWERAISEPRRSPEETGRLAEAIYERDIRAHVAETHDGAFLAIDVDSGRWAVSESMIDVADRLRTDVPDAVDIFVLRVGYRAAASIGGGSPREIR